MPPIAKNGTRRVRGGVADELQPDRRTPRLGRGRVDGPDADVVDERRRRTASISAGAWVESPISMSGADELAHLRDRHVLLADVHAVGARLARDEGRSLTINSAPSRSHSARAALATATSSSSGSCFSRSWTISTPPAIAARSRSGSAASARRRIRRSTPQTRYSRAAARRSTPLGAEVWHGGMASASLTAG